MTDGRTGLRIKRVPSIPTCSHPDCEKHADVAADYGVVKGAVSAIMSGRTWTHATGITRYAERAA